MSIKFNSLLSKGVLFLGLLALVGFLSGSAGKQAMASEMESTVGIEFTGEGTKIKLPDTGGDKIDVEVPNSGTSTGDNYLPQTGESKSYYQWFLFGLLMVVIALYRLIKSRKMNIKNLNATKFSLFGLLLLLLLSPRQVEAVDGGQMKTEGDVGFRKNTDITPPVDPLNPDKPLEPFKPPTAGPLSLNYVSDIQFGSYDLADSETIFYASLDTIKYADSSKQRFKRPNFVELTDNRGLNTGWRLTVKQNGQLKNADGAELNGAKLAFNNTSIVSLDEITATPTGFTKDAVLLNDNQNVLVMAAKNGTGMGSWSVNFGQDDTEGERSISLTVPKDSVKEKGHYTTSLTWTLSDSI